MTTKQTTRRTINKDPSQQYALNLMLCHPDAVKEFYEEGFTADFFDKEWHLLIECIYEEWEESKHKRLLSRDTFRGKLLQRHHDKPGQVIIPLQAHDKAHLGCAADIRDLDMLKQGIKNRYTHVMIHDAVRAIADDLTANPHDGKQSLQHAIKMLDACETKLTTTTEQFPSPLSWNSLMEQANALRTKDFLWQGIICPGDMVQISAPMKEGKTTFVLSLLKALSDGTTFFRPTKECKLLYISEETSVIWQERSKKHGYTLNDNVLLYTCDTLNYKSENPGQWNRLWENALRLCKEKGLDVVILDTLLSFAQWEDGNNAIDTRKGLSKLQALKNQGITTIFVHHEPKNKWADTENAHRISGIGSTYISAITDTNMSVKRYGKSSPNGAKLTIVGRIAGMVEVELTYNAETGLYECESQKTLIEDTIKEFLADGEPRTVMEIAHYLETAGIDGHKNQTRLKEMIESFAWIEKTGLGRKDSPYRFQSKVCLIAVPDIDNLCNPVCESETGVTE